MSEPLKAVETVTDPDNVPVRVINGSAVNVVGSLVALTLNTLRVGFDAKGDLKEDRVVAARLRFDLEIAKVIRDQLNIQIGALSAPIDTKPN